MSHAGFNVKGKIWRLSTLVDDDQGGAVPTGTVIYNPVFARIRSEKPTLALLEQGLSIPTIFSAQLSYTSDPFDVQDNDQYEVTFPPISPLYGKKFVIIGTQPSSFVDSRRYIQVTLRREEYANSNNLQT